MRLTCRCFKLVVGPEALLYKGEREGSDAINARPSSPRRRCFIARRVDGGTGRRARRIRRHPRADAQRKQRVTQLLEWLSKV